MASSAESRASGLYAARPNTDAIDATLIAPDAATIRNTANTCGMPHTMRLLMPVTWWPSTSMWCAASSASATSAANPASGAQKPGPRSVA